MAPCTSLSSFKLAHGVSSVHPKDFTSSKPLFGSFSPIMKARVRDTSNWVSMNLQAISRSYHPRVVTWCSDNEVAKLAENDEDKEKKEEGVTVEGGDAALGRPKLKKWKPTLLPGVEKVVIFSPAYMGMKTG